MTTPSELYQKTIGECLAHSDRRLQEKAEELFIELVRVREEEIAFRRVISRIAKWEEATKAQAPET